MKKKSKLVLFAIVVLQALLLIMPVSAIATTDENDQEIGVPQAMEAPVNGCYGAVLSPDGGHFYTLREGFLTQYQINPFKKISSIALDQEPFKERKYGGNCSVLITEDKAKLILLEYDRIFLLDASTGKVLKKYERTRLERSMVAAEINGDELMIIEAFSTGYEQYLYNMVRRDVKTLKIKSEINDLGIKFGFLPDGKVPRVAKVLNRIFLINRKSVVVLDSKTYAPELFVWSNQQSLYGPLFSYNFQQIYVQKVSKMEDHLTGKQATFDDVKADSVLVFDQETRRYEIKNENPNKLPVKGFVPFYGRINPNVLSKGYVITSPTQGGVNFVNVKTGQWINFKQNEFGEALLRAIGEPYFQSTPGARKYLMMKNSAGKVVPINDATFTKYHRTE